ncbi:unnamed protein product [Paramecium sonneborni]|uniref:Rho-GAP domain-containing protein n=1 Tax=Paramecium sonneborni TaxID=65129 RepID=A0A8S1MB61_9CILI|nr:unnamed protein product [Paramecium sonneborni]
MNDIRQENIITKSYNIETVIEQNYLKIYLNEESYQQFAVEYLLDCLNISVNKVVIIIKYVSLFEFIKENLILDIIRKAPKLHSIFILGDNQVDEYKEKNIFRIESLKEIGNILIGLEKKNSFLNEKLNKYGVPIILQELLKYYKNNMQHEGLFRKCAINSEIHELLNEVKGYNFTRIKDANPHLVACTLKQYLSQLEISLINCDQVFQKELNAFNVINNLSEINARIFYMICSFLQEVAKFEGQNKMNLKSLGILITPSLVKFSNECENPLEKMNKAIMFIQRFLENFHRFVPNFHYEELLEIEEDEIEQQLEDLDLKKEWEQLNKKKQHK